MSHSSSLFNIFYPFPYGFNVKSFFQKLRYSWNMLLLQENCGFPVIECPPPPPPPPLPPPPPPPPPEVEPAKPNENVKCEPEVLIKVEDSNNVVVNIPEPESESDTESDSDSESESESGENSGVEESSLPVAEQDGQPQEESTTVLLTTDITEASTSHEIHTFDKYVFNLEMTLGVVSKKDKF